MQLPLNLELRPSRLTAVYLFVLHLAAAGGLATLGLPFRALGPIIVALAASLVFGVRRHALRRAPDAVVALRLMADGALELRHATGEIVAATVQPASAILPFATVLLAREAGRRRDCAVVVAPDALPAEEARNLRLWLRWRAGFRNAN